MAERARFDIKRPLVAARGFIFAGESYEKGDPFPKSAPVTSFNPQLIKRQYEARAVDHTVEEDPAADPVQMTGPKGGRYTITAPWLAEPEIVRGKVPAETRLAEIKAEGAPLGFIEGGSEVTVEEGEGGGWFVVNAPWLDEPEKIQGRDAAEARQRHLHESKPEDFQPAGGEGGETTETATEGAEGADGAAATDTEANQDPADPHKGAAEKIPGTGPAQAADDVEAAAGGKPASE